MADPSVSVIIPTFNGKKFLQKNLPLVFNAIKKIKNCEIILVDNNSNDKTENFIKKNFRKIKYLKLNKNYGFSYAINIGAKYSKSQYLLFLNNDCYINSSTILELIDFANKKRQYAATQPIVYAENGTIENIGFIIDAWRGFAKPITSIKELHKRSPTINSRYIYGFSATCLLIRRDIFVKIGMFDESFHSYLEDVDLAIRLKKNGYKVAPCLESFCHHVHMGTSSHMGSFKAKHDLINWIRIVFKNYSFKFVAKHFPSLFIERLRNLSGYIKSFNLLK